MLNNKQMLQFIANALYVTTIMLATSNSTARVANELAAISEEHEGVMKGDGLRSPISGLNPRPPY